MYFANLRRPLSIQAGHDIKFKLLDLHHKTRAVMLAKEIDDIQHREHLLPDTANKTTVTKDEVVQ